MHGDLKGANILVVRESNGHLILKLCDMGESVLLDPSQQLVPCYQLAYPVGTQAFMAPEVT